MHWDRESVRRPACGGPGYQAVHEDLRSSLFIFETGNHVVFSSWKSGEGFREGPGQWLAAPDSKAEIKLQAV